MRSRSLPEQLVAGRPRWLWWRGGLRELVRLAEGRLALGQTTPAPRLVGRLPGLPAGQSFRSREGGRGAGRRGWPVRRPQEGQGAGLRGGVGGQAWGGRGVGLRGLLVPV